MNENYSILVKDADKNLSDINDYKKIGFEEYQLPENMVLMVAEDAPEEIKNAALDAGNGDYNSLQVALGISEY
jgi:putative lipoic acid-binding regulatory protein